MKLLLKLLLFIIFICLTLLSGAQKLPKLAKDANSLYKDGKFEQAIKLCEVILLSDKKTPDDIGAKASASWISCWIYKHPAYSEKDLNKSYQYAQKTAVYYDQLIEENPKLQKYLANLIRSISQEKQKMIIEFPGCEKGEYSITTTQNIIQIAETVKKEELEQKESTPTKNDTIVDNQAINSQKDVDKTVTLTVTGQGKTIDEAKTNALRSAIEQAFGTFISSNTIILNDSLIKDEITSLANGNIKKFEIINEIQLKDGSFLSTLKIEVSIGKLNLYCKSNGISVEFEGGLFTMNIKQQLLNEEAEVKSIHNTLYSLQPLLLESFNYEISYDPPISVDGGSNNWLIKYRIATKSNSNLDVIYNYLSKLFSSLSLTINEKENYESLKKTIFPISLNSTNYYFRSEKSIQYISILMSDVTFAMRNFVIENGIENISGYEAISTPRGSPVIDKGEVYHSGNCTDTYNGYNFVIGSGLTGSYEIERTYDNVTLSRIKKISVEPSYPASNIGKLENGGRVFYEDSNIVLIHSMSQFVISSGNGEATCRSDRDIGSGRFNTMRLLAGKDTSSLFWQAWIKVNAGELNTWYIPSLNEGLLLSNHLAHHDDYNSVIGLNRFFDYKGGRLCTSSLKKDNYSDYEYIIVEAGRELTESHWDTDCLIFIKYVYKNKNYDWMRNANCL